MTRSALCSHRSRLAAERVLILRGPPWRAFGVPRYAVLTVEREAHSESGLVFREELIAALRAGSEPESARMLARIESMRHIPHVIDWEGGTVLEFIEPPDDDARVTSRGGSA